MDSYNTDTIRYADRPDYWREAVSRTFVPLDSFFSGEERNGQINSVMRGPLRVSEIACSAQQVIRARKGADNYNCDVILLSLVSAGSTCVQQAGKEGIVGPGALGLYDTRFPYALHLNGAARQHVVQIPISQLHRKLGHTEPLLARSFGERHPMTPFLCRLVETLMYANSLSTEQAAVINHQFIDLLSVIIAEEFSTPLNVSRHAEGLLLAIKTKIAQRLADPNLSSHDLAASLHISTRYLNMLLSKEGESFGRYLLKQRLTKAAETLRSPYHLSTPISQIAWQNGFNDMSYFSRAFKNFYQCSPSDYRGLTRSQ
ncbi:helix-turn-helix domain-containing protein [Rosenbergiella nectarea]|uniref:helix-turn-helix domain-containing protein n=1 Tax=Rosenbergiella nectarea TaxID=988801 RepID=UPI001BDA6A48|nr:helix-turn-helix domain-containing protein [Rosenbergiella nectarea]MBT0729493.1 helix-turn-helix domain-containing protein [Rosenbergiella nectarea subsp. apis]